jgi:hypothetical protein
MELSTPFPHPRPLTGPEAKEVLAPLVNIDDPANIGAYVVLVVDQTGALCITGTNNIPPHLVPEFLEWAAQNARATLREAN